MDDGGSSMLVNVGGTIGDRPLVLCTCISTAADFPTADWSNATGRTFLSLIIGGHIFISTPNRRNNIRLGINYQRQSVVLDDHHHALFFFPHRPTVHHH